MCKECRYFDTAITDVFWCRKLCVPLHEEAGPCIMFEPEEQHEVVLPAPVSAPVPQSTITKASVQKGHTHVRIKCFAD